MATLSAGRLSFPWGAPNQAAAAAPPALSVAVFCALCIRSTRLCMKQRARSLSPSSAIDANTWFKSGWSTKRYQRQPIHVPSRVRRQYSLRSFGAGPGHSKHGFSVTCGGPRNLPSFFRVGDHVLASSLALTAAGTAASGTGTPSVGVPLFRLRYRLPEHILALVVQSSLVGSRVKRM